MTKLGFIGLGIMGGPMARHLLQAGFQVTVFNRTREKAEKLLEFGAKIANTPAEVAKNSDVIFTMLENSKVVEQVALGSDGIIFGHNPGLIFINCSTVSPESNLSLYEKLREYNIEMLDVPVTGSGIQAEAGQLTFMCGGNKETYEKLIPYFNAMGKGSFYMGEIGAGSYTKLASNTMLALNMVSLAEGLIIASKANVDPELFVQVVSGGGSKSAMAEAKTPKIVNRDFKPAFKTSLMLKDVGLAIDLAQELKIPTPVLSLAKELFKLAEIKGYGNDDMCSLIKCYEDWADIQVLKK